MKKIYDTYKFETYQQINISGNNNYETKKKQYKKCRKWIICHRKYQKRLYIIIIATY